MLRSPIGLSPEVVNLVTQSDLELIVHRKHKCMIRCLKESVLKKVTQLASLHSLEFLNMQSFDKSADYSSNQYCVKRVNIS